MTIHSKQKVIKLVLKLMLSFVTIILLTLLVQLKGQLSINLVIDSNLIQMYSGSTFIPRFLDQQRKFHCSSHLYSYSQSATNYKQNSPYGLSIKNNAQSLSLSFSTRYNNFQPTLSLSTCTDANCNIQIQNNCPLQLNNDNYFDIVSLTVAPIGTFSYNVNCDIGYNSTKFELGQLIIIIAATLILIIACTFARLNSFDGKGIQYGYGWITIISLGVIFVGLISLFLPYVAEIFMDVTSTIAIFISVPLVIIEFIYFFKLPILNKYFSIMQINIRVMDIIGVLLSIPVAVAWWLLDKNWIITDLISICIIISVIKVFKFVSFKIALVAYIVMVCVYSAADIVIAIVYKEDYNNFFLNNINTPFQLQVPLISPDYSQKCSWISVTTIAFPGILISYLRRFDQSRLTNIYLITSICTYFLGSILWWIADTFSYYPVPFDAFCEPVMMGAFSLFAFKRKELRTLWEGKFYDQEFVNKNQVDQLGQRMKNETVQPDHFMQNLVDDMYFHPQDDSQLQPSQNIKNKNDNDKL